MNDKEEETNFSRLFDPTEKEKKCVLYLGFRYGKPVWSDKKWEGLETEYNKDIGDGIVPDLPDNSNLSGQVA